jgi:hypothetical protein
MRRRPGLQLVKILAIAPSCWERDASTDDVGTDATISTLALMLLIRALAQAFLSSIPVLICLAG